MICTIATNPIKTKWVDKEKFMLEILKNYYNFYHYILSPHTTKPNFKQNDLILLIGQVPAK